MKEITIILLLILILSPVLRNGLGLIHYLVEHTHAFCINKTDHQHSSSEDCETMCSLQFDEPSKNENFPAQRLEYQEIKQYISSFISCQIAPTAIHSSAALFHSSHLEQQFIKEIFHPPIIS